MTMTLAPLFTLSVTHEFYGGACADLGFVVPAGTAQLLRGAFLLTKVQGGSLLVLSASDEGGPMASIAGRTLRFGVRIDNPLFGNFTRALDPAAGALLYRNSALPTALDAAVSIPLVGRSMRHAPALPKRPVTVNVRRPGGPVILSETVTVANDRKDVSFDLSALDPGELRVEESYEGTSQNARRYVEPELASQGVLGVVEITVAPGFYTSAPTFSLPFTARQDTLKYYVVTNYANGDLADLNVADQGFAEQGRAEVKFTRAPSLGPNDIPAALLTDPSRKVVLFASNAAVPRRMAGRKGIKLLRKAEVLIENLPQPGAGKAAADVIIHLSKP